MSRKSRGSNRQSTSAAASTATDPSAAPSAAAKTPPAASSHDDVPTLLGLQNVFAVPYFFASTLTKAFLLLFIAVALHAAYTIRLRSVQQYGYIIHEFDPWFNYRATQYLEEHGWTAFFRWFDYMSWYPLGRPVGTTIYPGLQITAVGLHRLLNHHLGVHMSLNDVCVLIPAWFGAVATLLLALLTFEAAGSLAAAAAAAMTFAVVPAHTMRSMAGEFDNECIAVTAMLLTFYCWVRSLRGPRSWPVGALAGLAYGYMVAAWGGYIFVLNMVALHAAVTALLDWARNTYSPALLKAYSLFFVIGTAIATRVPPVGLSPFKSLEQLAALLVFVFLWGLQVAEWRRAKLGDVQVRSRAALKLRLQVFFALSGVLLAVVVAVVPAGYFGPLSSRVRALFVAHTRTGNPLVDSVAEHQPATSSAYVRLLNAVYPMWIAGTFVLPLMPTPNRQAVSFLIVYSLLASYFCTRMARLMLIAGPVACATGSCAVGKLSEWMAARFFWNSKGVAPDVLHDEQQLQQQKVKHKSPQQQQHVAAAASRPSSPTSLIPVRARAVLRLNAVPSNFATASAVFFLVVLLSPMFFAFLGNASVMANGFANPRIIFSVRHPTEDGKPILVKDYYDSYRWLAQHTPPDARVLAWWDYGYQITGIANRTTLADGNTWNHEHIATIGKMLTSPVVEAHSLVRHMADYVLIWAGQAGSDLMKSPHMARIGNSVYRDICPNDPLCSHFGFFDRDRQRPTPMMRRSLLYHLHESQLRRGVSVDPRLFREVHSSVNGLVRIFQVMNVSQKSKAWVADPANRVCDAPGSWICPGQYPPAKPIQDMLAKRVDFAQLEDFNRKKRDDEYHKAYMTRTH